MVLGGINGDDIFGMSGGWQRDFELGGLSEVTLSFRYYLTQSPFYEDNELSQILISLDGVLIGVSPNDHIDQISGNGNGGPDETTGWQQVELNLGSLSAGTHTLILGGYNKPEDRGQRSRPGFSLMTCCCAPPAATSRPPRWPAPPRTTAWPPSR